MPPARSLTQTEQRAERRHYKPDALMYVTAAFLMVAVWRFQDLWPIFGKLQAPILLELALAVMLVTSLNGPRNPKWIKSRVLVFPFLLLAIMIVGLPASLWTGRSFIFVTKDFAPTILLMLGVAVSVRESEDIEWLAFCHLIGASVYSMWSYLFVSVGSDGRLAGGIHYDANDLALLLVSTLPFALYFLRPAVATWKRLFALGSLALYLEMIIKSGSRGGFLALIAVIVYIVLAFRFIPVRLRITAVSVAFLAIAVLGGARYWNMMQTITNPEDDYNMTSEIGRKAIWKRGVGYMITHPLLGVGVNDFEQAEGTLSAISRQYAAAGRGLKWSTAHNSFVLIGAELGFGGLVLFVAMIGTSVSRLARIKGGPGGDPGVNPEDTIFAQTLIASLIGFCAAGFFVSAAYFSYLYYIVGLVVAEDSLRRRRRARAARQPVVEATTQPREPNHRQKQIPRTHWAPTG
jgi:O-antigen ligase